MQKILQVFVNKVGDEQKEEVEKTRAQGEQFKKISKLFKQDKKMRQGIQIYQDMIMTEQISGQEEVSIRDVLEDRKLTKMLFQGNLLDKEYIQRIKDDVFYTSVKLASYGKRRDKSQL